MIRMVRPKASPMPRPIPGSGSPPDSAAYLA